MPPKLHLSILCALGVLCGSLHAADKPNVVLILSDDMGYADLPGFGADKEIATPNLDRLRSGGTVFTDAYVCAPICVPSRMGLFSGRHPARFGVYNNNHAYTLKGNQPGFERFIGEKLMPAYFKDAGYATALVGKWHLAGNDADPASIAALPEAHRPEAKGFDEVCGISGGMAYFWKGTKLYETGAQATTAPAYLTDHFGDRSVDFIRRKKDGPFFLYLGFNAVHAPLQALVSDVQAAGYDEKKYQHGSAKENRDAAMDRAVYAGMLRAMDRNIGKVLDALRDAGVEGNTLVVFLNDNGGPSLTAEVVSYNQASNAPHRGHKYDVLEGGVRVPFILRWPGQIPAGKSFSGLTSSLDLLPTFLAAIGQSTPDAAALDGVNLLPFVRGEKSGDPHEALFWQVNHGTAEHPHQFAIRSGPWKLHQGVTGGNPIPKPGQWQLYDLRNDPGEEHDLAAQRPDIVKDLSAKWKAWRAQMPNAALPAQPKKGKQP